MFNLLLPFFLALSSIGTILGAESRSILDAFPGLKNLTLGNTFGYEWHTTDEWRCPLFKTPHLNTSLSVLKAGQCSFKPVTVPAAGPVLSCCGIKDSPGGPTCSYARSVSYTNERSTTFGWKVGVSAKFGNSMVTGEYSISAEHSKTITESTGTTSGTSLSWNNLDPGYVYVPTVSYLKINCTGFNYHDTPKILRPRLSLDNHINNYDLDPPTDNWPHQEMRLSIPKDQTCGVPRSSVYKGYYDRSMKNPGVVALWKDSRSQDLGMANNYKDLWSDKDIELPLLDGDGHILSVFDLEKRSCSKMHITDNGYIDIPTAVDTEGPDLLKKTEDGNSSAHPH